MLPKRGAANDCQGEKDRESVESCRRVDSNGKAVLYKILSDGSCGGGGGCRSTVRPSIVVAKGGREAIEGRLRAESNGQMPKAAQTRRLIAKDETLQTFLPNGLHP